MDNQEFVDAIKIVVLDGSIKSVESVLENPPGRSPAQRIIELSNWYKNLNSDDKKMLLKVIREALNTSVFLFCCILDGVNAIEGLGEKGILKLYYEKDGESILLNDPSHEYLHNLLRS